MRSIGTSDFGDGALGSRTLEKSQACKVLDRWRLDITKVSPERYISKRVLLGFPHVWALPQPIFIACLVCTTTKVQSSFISLAASRAQ